MGNMVTTQKQASDPTSIQFDDITTTTDVQMNLQDKENDGLGRQCPSRPQRQCRKPINYYDFGRGGNHKLAKDTKKLPEPRKAAVKNARVKTFDGNKKADEKNNILAISDNKQSSACGKRTNAKKQTGQSTSASTSTRIPCVPAENQPRKRTHKRPMSYADVDDNTRSRDRSVRARNVSRNRAVSIDQNNILDDSYDPNSTLVIGKNTKREMYGKNSLCGTCIYCNKKFHGSIVQHYVNNHSDREVVISRMSPDMAMQLKQQVESFHQDKKKRITGLCYFCEEKKAFAKDYWQKHLITHTGETMFNCRQCHAQLKTKSEHDTKVCKQSVVKVFETKEDGSLVGFMCNDCNYFQFSRGRILKHLVNEHGFQNPTQSHQFQEWVVVKTKNE